MEETAPKKPRAVLLAAAFAVVTVGSGVTYGLYRYLRPVSAREAIPADAFFSLHVNGTFLRNSFLGTVLTQALPALRADRSLNETDNPIGALARLDEACGFPVLSRLDELVIFAQERTPGAAADASTPMIGAALRGEVSATELATCSRGVVASDTSQLRRDGSFYRGEKADLGIAYALGARRPFLVGPPASVDAAVATVDGLRVPFSNGAAGLRKANVDASASPYTYATAWLHRTAAITRLLKGAAAFLPTAELARGLPSVDEALVVVRGTGSGKNQAAEGVSIALDAECTDVSGCKDVATFLKRERFELGKNLAVRLLGFGSTLDQAAISDGERGGRGTLRIAVTLDGDTLGGAAALVGH
jgi:hypothetical protein